jgi:hypothetical protein
VVCEGDGSTVTVTSEVSVPVAVPDAVESLASSVVLDSSSVAVDSLSLLVVAKGSEKNRLPVPEVTEQARTVNDSPLLVPVRV